MAKTLEHHLESGLLFISKIEDTSLGLFHEYTKSVFLQEKNNFKEN